MPIFRILDSYNFAILVALIIAISFFFQKKEIYDKTFYLVITILVMITALEAYGTYTSNRHIQNLFYYNIFFFYGETVLILAYFYLIRINERVKKAIIAGSVIFSIWFAVNSLINQPITTHSQTNSYLMGSLLIIAFSGKFFYEIFSFKRYPNGNLLAIPHFWIVTGIFFFYSASFMFFISLQVPNIDTDFLLSIYPLVRWLSVLMYLLMALAFYAPLIFKDKVNLKLH